MSWINGIPQSSLFIFTVFLWFSISLQIVQVNSWEMMTYGTLIISVYHSELQRSAKRIVRTRLRDLPKMAVRQTDAVAGRLAAVALSKLCNPFSRYLYLWFPPLTASYFRRRIHAPFSREMCALQNMLFLTRGNKIVTYPARRDLEALRSNGA